MMMDDKCKGYVIGNLMTGRLAETWERAPYFRWHKADADAPAVLQQALVSSQRKVKWEPLPVVVGDEP